MDIIENNLIKIKPFIKIDDEYNSFQSPSRSLKLKSPLSDQGSELKQNLNLDV